MLKSIIKLLDNFVIYRDAKVRVLSRSVWKMD